TWRTPGRPGLRHRKRMIGDPPGHAYADCPSARAGRAAGRPPQAQSLDPSNKHLLDFISLPMGKHAAPRPASSLVGFRTHRTGDDGYLSNGVDEAAASGLGHSDRQYRLYPDH